MRNFAAVGLSLLAAALCARATAAECTLTQVNSIDLFMSSDRQALVPITINDVPRLLLLDTGGYTSQLSPDVVRDLNLAPHRAAVELHDVSGNTSHAYVIVDSLKLGTMAATKTPLMVSPANFGLADGLLSNDMLLRYDVEMDFAGGKLNYFSQDHCPGKVVYWNPSAVSAVPMRVRDRAVIMIDVTLDGHPFRATLDTGATRSTIGLPVARGAFNLDPTSPGVTPIGNVNGDDKLASYKYTFKTLAFEGVGIANPTFVLMPERIAGATPELGTRLPPSDLRLPELILGMDILRHLHIFMAFKEGVMYVSGAAPKSAQDMATGQSNTLNVLDKVLALSPHNANMLNERCWDRALSNIKLEEALADCDLALSIRHDNAPMLDSRGLVLYRLGRFKDALETYNKTLAREPDYASSLYMRGQTKKKLGDAAGGDADIAAAKKQGPDALVSFKGTDLQPQ